MFKASKIFAGALTVSSHNVSPAGQTVDGHLNYLWSARGGAPVWLWVHGYTFDGTVWAPLWKLLPEVSHVGLDLPGHGQSAPLSGNETLDDFALAVSKAAEETGGTTVIGQSFGGSVALQSAILRPDLFENILLASPALLGGPVDQQCADCNQELMRMARERGCGPWLSERWLSVPPRIFQGTLDRPVLRERIASIVARHRWSELFTTTFPAMLQVQQTPQAIRRISGSISLLVGEHDMPAFIRSAEMIRRAAQRATVDYLPGTGHLTILEDPAKGLEWIRRVLRIPMATPGAF